MQPNCQTCRGDAGATARNGKLNAKTSEAVTWVTMDVCIYMCIHVPASPTPPTTPPPVVGYVVVEGGRSVCMYVCM